MTARSLSALLILYALSSAVSPAGWCADQDEAAGNPKGDRSLRYVRVYVPTDRLSLEDCLAFINDDELVEVTPGAIRLRERN